MAFHFIKKNLLGLLLALVLAGFWATPVHAAKFLLSPSSGTFTVGSTFDVNVFLDTEGKPVNTVSAILLFPPDKLQLVSPTVGQSVINVWTAQPVFDNQKGVVSLVGGIPGGINVQSGLITSLTFRVKQVGNSTLLKFSDESRILANDGSGTDVLGSVQNGVYNLILPPPQGPIVSSETHPDQSKWYANRNVILRWANTSSVENYSYIVDDDPLGVPDNISEGNGASIIYKDLTDGIHYFHIKSLRDGVWGGVTSFGINVDTQPPAEFSLEFNPSNRTSSKNQIVNFQTSDSDSGISYYELKVIPLNSKATSPNNNNLFVEATSPYQFSLGIGSYDVIVRAYDKAGNYREIISRLKVVTPVFEIVSGQGIKVFSLFIISWFWVWFILCVIAIVLLYTTLEIRKWHYKFLELEQSRELPSDIKKKLETLKTYRKKYGSLVLLLVLTSSLLFSGSVQAEQISQIDRTQLSPPYISTISRDISNEEIFYVGGKTDNSGITVLIYLQNLQTGETFNESVVSDLKGDWFYRHSKFLSAGKYLLWTQSRLGDQSSPPSPQMQIAVQNTAIQFGASRFSYEMIYLIGVIIFLCIIVILVGFILYHAYRGRKKHKIFWKEVIEAEESIRRGFAVLKRDIEAELAVIKKAKLSNALLEEERQKEENLLRDLEAVQKNISKEVWDIEHTEHND